MSKVAPGDGAGSADVAAMAPAQQEMARSRFGTDVPEPKPTAVGEKGSRRISMIDPKSFDMTEIMAQPDKEMLSWIPGVLCFPATLLGSWYVLQPRKEAVVLHCGHVTRKIDNEGCHFVNCFFRDIKEIETSQISYDMKNQKITDVSGNPVLVSAIVTYRFTDPISALFNVHNPKSFVTTQASAVLKEVVGSFSYEELKVEADEICQRSVETLQERVNVAGAHVLSVNLNELNYAQEIAASMLKKQQAQALIEARELLVRGAVDISRKMVESLAEEKVDFSEASKSKLVSDLIIMSIGDNNSG